MRSKDHHHHQKQRHNHIRWSGVASSLPVFLSMVLFLASTQSSMALSFSSTKKCHFVGFDLGTSGARISILEKKDKKYKEVYSDALTYKTSYDDPKSWTDAVDNLLTSSPPSLLSTVQSICVSGTSSSCLLLDSTTGRVTRPPKMYNYDTSTPSTPASLQTSTLLSTHCPPNHTATAPTSTLAKLLHYHLTSPLLPNEILAHQSDYVASTFLHPPHRCGSAKHSTPSTRRTISTDWHNVLKLGYDVQTLQYPPWLLECLAEAGVPQPSLVLPPTVISPGTVISTVSSHFAKTYGVPEEAVVVGGTTDSNAAFFAACASSSSSSDRVSLVPEPGTAVTSLGSTLAIKMVSRTFVEDASRGVYSHRLPLVSSKDADETNVNSNSNSNSKSNSKEAWLVGGASNVGCAILRAENFSNEELTTLSSTINPQTDSPLEYYPLTKRGERFPVADGEKMPVLDPKPEDRGEYLKGILQGIAEVERRGYEALAELGALPNVPEMVWTCGGGARNGVWLEMRERWLSSLKERDGQDGGDGGDGGVGGPQVRRAVNTEASFGAAILAAASFS